MPYTVAGIKRIKTDDKGMMSLFLEPAVNFRVMMGSITHLLIINPNISFNLNINNNIIDAIPMSIDREIELWV